MILIPAKPGDPPCVVCGCKSVTEVSVNLRRTQFCDSCKRVLAAAFLIGTGNTPSAPPCVWCGQNPVDPVAIDPARQEEDLKP